MTTADAPASKEAVTAALLVIGGKILSGRTKDQNIGYIAEYLTAVGIDFKEVRVVGDEERAIVTQCAPAYLHHRRDRPTHGDITTDCVAKGVWCSDRHRSARARHPARMGEDDRRRDERGAPAPDPHPQGR